MSGTEINQVRQFVLSVLGGGPLSEAVLLQNLRYVGRKFASANGTAIWWAERNLIEVFDGEGKLIQSSVIDPADQPMTQAA
jgi:hypothetical protein